jgi:hypothetical protein
VAFSAVDVLLANSVTFGGASGSGTPMAVRHTTASLDGLVPKADAATTVKLYLLCRNDIVHS